MTCEKSRESFGVVVNRFYKLEPKYVKYFITELGKKAWLIDLILMCNRNDADKAEKDQAGKQPWSIGRASDND